jgi:hypothetical protein
MPKLGTSILTSKWQKEAIFLLSKDNASEKERNEYQERLKLYQSGKPYREDP